MLGSMVIILIIKTTHIFNLFSVDLHIQMYIQPIGMRTGDKRRLTIPPSMG